MQISTNTNAINNVTNSGRTPLKFPCTRGDYRGVGGEDIRCLHVFDESRLETTESAFLSVDCRAVTRQRPTGVLENLTVSRFLALKGPPILAQGKRWARRPGCKTGKIQPLSPVDCCKSLKPALSTGEWGIDASLRLPRRVRLRRKAWGAGRSPLGAWHLARFSSHLNVPIYYIHF